jgi:hypothetical protein
MAMRKVWREINEGNLWIVGSLESAGESPANTGVQSLL